MVPYDWPHLVRQMACRNSVEIAHVVREDVTRCDD
jgi:hypothetical protein